MEKRTSCITALVAALAFAALPGEQSRAQQDPLFAHDFENNPTGGPEIDFWYGDSQTFGAAGVPQSFANIVGNVDDVNGVSSLSYRLNGGLYQPLTLGRRNLRLAAFRDFNAEINFSALRSGSNQVDFRAVDGLNNETVRSINLNYRSGITTPRSYRIDWSDVDNISDVAQVVDGQWHITDAGVRTSEIGYDRIIAVGDLSWTNYEAHTFITVHAEPEEARCPLLAMAMRWTGHQQLEPDEQPGTQWWPLGAQAGFRWFCGDWTGLQFFGSNGRIRESLRTLPPLPINVRHSLKMRGETQPNGALRYRLKLWVSTEPEPDDWAISWTTLETSTPPPGGSLLLVAHHVDATFGDVMVTPVND